MRGNWRLAVKTLAVRLIGERCAESKEVRRIYKRVSGLFAGQPRYLAFPVYIVLSLCPQAFKDDLRSALFRLFEVERYREIASGAEYEKALQRGFPVLSDNDKQDYVQRVIRKFSQLHEYRKHKGSIHTFHDSALPR